MNSYSRASSVVSRQVAGETVLVPLTARTTNALTRGAELYTLNAAGVLLWERLSTPQTEESLTQSLVERYEIGPEQAREDVRSFLRDLANIGALNGGVGS